MHCLAYCFPGGGIVHNRQRTVWNGEGVYSGGGSELSESGVSVLQEPAGDDSEVHPATPVAAAYIYSW